MGVIYVVMIAAELLRGVTVRRWVVVVALGVAALAAFANFSYLRNNANGLAGIAEQEKGGLAALELTRGVVADDFELTEDNSGVDYLGIVDAASYFSAIDAYGSPAYTPAELAGSSERSRLSADKVFARALGVGLVPADEAAAGRCVTARPGTETGIVGAAAGRRAADRPLGIAADRAAPLRDRRRSRSSSARSPAGRARALAIPGDLSAQPWQLSVAGHGEPLGLRARGRDVSAGGAASAAAPAPASRIAAWAADPRLPTVLLGAAAVVSAVLLVVLNSKLTFFIDDWEVLLHRRGLSLDVFMEPHAGHPAMGLVALYKAILVTFGMSSLTPYAVASTLVFVAQRGAPVRLDAPPRRRLAGARRGAPDPLPGRRLRGPADAVPGRLLRARGLRPRPRCSRSSAAARATRCCAARCSSSGSASRRSAWPSSPGWRSPWRSTASFAGARWVPIVPVVLYGLWYLGWGHTGATQFTFENLATAPAFVLDGFSASLASLLGFATPEDGGLEWGRALFAVLVVLAAARLLALGRVPKGVWVALAIGVVFWVMIALNASYFRSAETSRYQFLGAVFVLMFAAEVWPRHPSGAHGRRARAARLARRRRRQPDRHARRQPRPAQPGCRWSAATSPGSRSPPTGSIRRSCSTAPTRASTTSPCSTPAATSPPPRSSARPPTTRPSSPRRPSQAGRPPTG